MRPLLSGAAADERMVRDEAHRRNVTVVVDNAALRMGRPHIKLLDARPTGAGYLATFSRWPAAMRFLKTELAHVEP